MRRYWSALGHAFVVAALCTAISSQIGYATSRIWRAAASKGGAACAGRRDPRAVLASALATIRLPGSPGAVVVSPQLGRTYVTTLDTGRYPTPYVGIVDTVSGRLLRVLHAGSPVSGVAVDPARGHLFLVLGDGENVLGVEMRDARSGRVLRAVRPSHGHAAFGYDMGETGEADIDPRARRFFLPVVPSDRSQVLAFDTATGALAYRLVVGLARPEIAVSPGTGRVFVSDGTGAVATFASRSGRRLRTVHVSGQPAALTLDAATRRLFVSADITSMLDAASGAFLSKVPYGGGEVLVVPATGRVFVAGSSADLVAMLDGRSGRLLRWVALPGHADRGQPIHLGAVLDRSGLVEAFDTGQPGGRGDVIVGPPHLYLLDARTDRLRERITLGRASGVPSGILAVDDARGRAFLENADGSLRLVDISCL